MAPEKRAIYYLQHFSALKKVLRPCKLTLAYLFKTHWDRCLEYVSSKISPNVHSLLQGLHTELATEIHDEASSVKNPLQDTAGPVSSGPSSSRLCTLSSSPEKSPRLTAASPCLLPSPDLDARWAIRKPHVPRRWLMEVLASLYLSRGGHGCSGASQFLRQTCWKKWIWFHLWHFSLYGRWQWLTMLKPPPVLFLYGNPRHFKKN